MSKTINFGAEATKTAIGPNTKVRIQIRNGTLALRFTERSNITNIKNDLLKELRVKGSGRRISVPAEFADVLEIGSQFVLHPAKHGWHIMEQVKSLMPGSGHGRVSAQ